MIMNIVLFVTACFSIVLIYGAPIKDTSTSGHADVVVTNAGPTVQSMDGPGSTSDVKGRAHFSVPANDQPVFTDGRSLPMANRVNQEFTRKEDKFSLVDLFHDYKEINGR